MLKITASLADGIPVDLRDTLTGLDDTNIRLLITVIHHASGRRPENSGLLRVGPPNRTPSKPARGTSPDPRQSEPGDKRHGAGSWSLIFKVVSIGR